MKDDDAENANVKKLRIKMMDLKHVCQPKKYKCYKAPSETEIINSPDFNLLPNKNGIQNGILFTFDSEDRKKYRKFYLKGGSYRCLGCNNMKKCTTAWLRNESGQQYVEVRTPHICEPRTYGKTSLNSVVFNAPDFELHTNRNGAQNGTLIIYASEDRKTCWKFRVNQKNYRCTACSKKKHHTAAWLLANESGEQYVEVRAPHICEPRKYEPPKEPVEYIIIPSSQFELFQNAKGITNSRLHFFTSPDKTSHYEFFLAQG